MKFVEPRPFADPEAAAQKLIELANAFDSFRTETCLNIMVNR
jgi:hypothetical protein